MNNFQNLDMNYYKQIAERVNREKAQERAEALKRKDVAPEEVKVEQAKEENQTPAPLINTNLNPDNYLQIPNTNEIIAINQSHGNLNYEEVHKTLLSEGLKVPTPDLFMKHFINVINSYNKKTQLITASGNPLGKKQTGELYEKLTHDCWTWLNAKFVKGKGCLSLDLETITGINKDGTLKKIVEPLEECMDRDTYVQLNFNRQGLTKFADVSQKYSQGKNIYFFYPRKGAVARFDADSGRASLDCNGDPDSRYAGLGVFASTQQGASVSPKN
jgi:hypothetical protein